MSCCAQPHKRDQSDVADAEVPANAEPWSGACDVDSSQAKAATPRCVRAVSLDLPEMSRQFHSAIRWAKPWPEIEEIVHFDTLCMKILATEKDNKTGNSAIHLAAQNGHVDIVRKLIQIANADVNAQNGQGNTPLHMSIAYDLYFTSKVLLEFGADGDIVNAAGNKAIHGIDGDHDDEQPWDHPLVILSAASDKEELEAAFTALEQADRESVKKEKLIQTGLMKKKSPKTAAVWDHKRFMELAKKF